jgi:hypothetical protein
MTVALAIYAAGVIVGLLLTDARWPARVGLALAWPLGPIAFLITSTILIVAAAIAFPLLGAIAVAALIGWRLLL